VLKIVESLWTGGAPPRTTLGELTALPQTPIAGGEGLSALYGACCPSPRTPPLISAFGLDFRPNGPHSAASPAVFIPQFLEFWIKHLTGYLLLRYTQKKIPSTPTGDSPHPTPRGIWPRRLNWMFTIVIRLTEIFG